MDEMRLIWTFITGLGVWAFVCEIRYWITLFTFKSLKKKMKDLIEMNVPKPRPTLPKEDEYYKRNDWE